MKVTFSDMERFKITVHPARVLPWREWRLRDKPATFALTNTPPCIEQVPA
jgi:hypothetical protein